MKIKTDDPIFESCLALDKIANEIQDTQLKDQILKISAAIFTSHQELLDKINWRLDQVLELAEKKSKEV
jgi:hypothetical protein